MRTATSRKRFAVKFAIVPLAALALAGLTACEDNDLPSKQAPTDAASAGKDAPQDDKDTKGAKDDKNDKSTGKPDASGKPTGKADPAAKPASSAKLSDTLLNAQEIPAGYSSGAVNTDPDEEERSEASDERCQPLVNGSMDKRAIGQAEVDFEKDGAEGKELVSVGLVSRPEADLKSIFDEYVAALKVCSSFEATQGTETLQYRVTGVQTGKYGPNSVVFKLEVTDGTVSSYGHAVLAYRGSTGISVGAISTEGLPAVPDTFARGQIQKVEEMHN
ncbi:hypothetical protein [Yinghuangia soli]|uniref:Lipoprotein n=1 Tax=Yinghuangia soli TaxID=2908204 RepID=A0AA41Q2Z4_9ACTN|nr:hypothetical protein [Yinghuangia soli]MCF2530603.1 hypothetical protein [Yinghuangia soli]